MSYLAHVLPYCPLPLDRRAHKQQGAADKGAEGSVSSIPVASVSFLTLSTNIQINKQISKHINEQTSKHTLYSLYLSFSSSIFPLLLCKCGI